MTTDLSITHSFDGYTENELEDCFNFTTDLVKTSNIEFKIEVENNYTYSIIINPNNEIISVIDFIELEDKLFSNVSDELLELLS
jgi:hypothetical protein